MASLEELHAHWIAAEHTLIREHGDRDARLATALTIVLARIDEDVRQRGYDPDNPPCNVVGLLRDLQRNPRLTVRSD